jgi:hypothetical protein
MASRTKTNNRGYYDRAGDVLGRARQEATTPRIIAAGAVAAGAAAYALLRDPARRERIRGFAQDYIDRGSAWWQERSSSPPVASEITVS